jgi:hypothetical protein
MTYYYVNNIIGSDSNGGTSEAQAWAGITCWLDQTKGFTGGDTLWIKGTTMMYDIGRGNWGTGTGTKYSFSTTTNYSPRIYVQGYSGVTGDNCVGGLKPTLTRNVGDGVSTQFGNWDLMQNGYATFANLHFHLNLSGTPHQNGIGMRGSLANIYRNISIHVASTYSTGQNSSIITHDSTNTGYFRPIDGVQITYASDVSMNVPGDDNLYSEQARQASRGAFIDASNVVSNDEVIQGFQSTDYSAVIQEGHVFIGKAGTDQIGMLYDIDASPYGVQIEKCVFVNLGTGIKFTTPQTDMSATNWSGKINMVVKDCIFINCGIGIDFDNTNLSDWKQLIEVVDCKFYNSTTNMINGTAGPFTNIMALTKNPWDDTNKRLNAYGKTLSTFPYKIYDVSTGLMSLDSGNGRDNNYLGIKMVEDRTGGAF